MSATGGGFEHVFHSASLFISFEFFVHFQSLLSCSFWEFIIYQPCYFPLPLLLLSSLFIYFLLFVIFRFLFAFSHCLFHHFFSPLHFARFFVSPFVVCQFFLLFTFVDLLFILFVHCHFHNFSPSSFVLSVVAFLSFFFFHYFFILFVVVSFDFSCFNLFSFFFICHFSFFSRLSSTLCHLMFFFSLFPLWSESDGLALLASSKNRFSTFKQRSQNQASVPPFFSRFRFPFFLLVMFGHVLHPFLLSMFFLFRVIPLVIFVLFFLISCFFHWFHFWDLVRFFSLPFHSFHSLCIFFIYICSIFQFVFPFFISFFILHGGFSVSCLIRFFSMIFCISCFSFFFPFFGPCGVPFLLAPKIEFATTKSAKFWAHSSSPSKNISNLCMCQHFIMFRFLFTYLFHSLFLLMSFHLYVTSFNCFYVRFCACASKKRNFDPAMPWAVACGQQLRVGTLRSHLLNVCACAAKQRSPLTPRCFRHRLQSRLLVWSKGGGLTTVGCPGKTP